MRSGPPASPPCSTAAARPIAPAGRLEVTEVALGDALAAAAGLVMGEAAEGIPAVLIRGCTFAAGALPAQSLIRPLEQDLFR